MRRAEERVRLALAFAERRCLVAAARFALALRWALVRLRCAPVRLRWALERLRVLVRRVLLWVAIVVLRLLASQ
ncbi:MAG: hypothetical protein JOZ25_01490 [Actinobacteria bacterium]|nr:hypothetical protein [Actinomycetota bacterium]